MTFHFHAVTLPAISFTLIHNGIYEMDQEISERSSYDYNNGLVYKTLAAGRYCVDSGFYVASRSTSIGVSIARGVITTTATVTGLLSGNVGLMAVLYGVDTTVGAAERVAQAAILLTQSMTHIGFTAVNATLEHTGAAESIEKGIRVKVGEVTGMLPWQNHADAIARILTMANSFIVPLRDLTNAEIKSAIGAFATLQQAHRLPICVAETASLAPTEDLARCMAFAAASYGPLAMNFLEYLPRGTYRSNVLSDLVPGISVDDIVVENQLESIYRPGYMVLLDHANKDIVVSLRGTMNPHDVLTDLTCLHSPCDEHIEAETSNCLGDCKVNVSEIFTGSKNAAPSHYAHEGFLRSAITLSETLRPVISRLIAEYPKYGLLVCGHSLGAGVASLLALKWANEYHFVRCVAFSPPCVLTLSAARAVSDRVTSVIVGDDMVCRFGIGTSLDLRDACLHLHHLSNFTENAASIDVVDHLRSTHMVNPKLYPPGKIIHIIKRNAGLTSAELEQSSNVNNLIGAHGDEIAYVSDQLTFAEMQISATMFSSHMPHSVLAKVRDIFPSKVSSNM